MATTFSGLWDELKAEALDLVDEAKAVIVNIEQSIVPVIEADIVTVLSQFKAIAIEMVLNFAKAEFDNMSGQEKQSEIVTHIYQQAVGAGHAIAIQDAQVFAQQAYTAVATTLAPAPQTAP